ncbi:MAG: hypothetical protein HN368_22225 [Spirochaetales bacterium]|jgi:hypothetical protein|nr:hypothetical protein [Spirochaetales bacterium]
MAIHYYLSVFPMEALIASQLDPAQFGAYMATGSKKGSKEQIIFIEVDGGFGEVFDWKLAKDNCVPHPNGDPKHSLYLGVYRILERTPIKSFRSMYLTTRDGRTIELEKKEYVQPENEGRGYFVYQELCPSNPVIVSRLAPGAFGKYMTSDTNKVSMPTLAFTDLKVINFDDRENTGNIGSLYDNKVPHLMQCISEVTSGEMKTNKTLTRTHVESFAFQTIDHGIFVSNGEEICMYRMPSIEEIKKIDYDWGRSANII